MLEDSWISLILVADFEYSGRLSSDISLRFCLSASWLLLVEYLRSVFEPALLILFGER